MTIEAASSGKIPVSMDDFRAIQKKVNGTNVNKQTLLATDYLNHFNEVVMLLEMIPDMPELLEEAKAWAPKSYQDHFRDSGFSDAAVAVEAYDHVPEKYLKPFERTIRQLDELIKVSIERLAADLKGGNEALLREDAKTFSRVIQRVQDIASGIIHGRETPMDQSEIDSLLD